MPDRPPAEIRVLSEPDAPERRDIIGLCERCFDERLGQYFEDIGPGTHVTASVGGRLVSHVMWVDRQLETRAPTKWRTAYVELVATDPDFRGAGFARQLMQILQARIAGYDVGALAPDETDLYRHLGWEWWRGPLYVREAGRWVPSDPDERIMIYRLPGTPASLDLDAPLSIEWRPGPEIW